MINYDKYIDNTIQILNSAGIFLMEISEDERKSALSIELKITKAASSQDVDQFFTLLDEWKTVMMRESQWEQLVQRQAA